MRMSASYHGSARADYGCATASRTVSWVATTLTTSMPSCLTRYHTKRLAALGYTVTVTKCAA
jgi:hypothetical protein